MTVRVALNEAAFRLLVFGDVAAVDAADGTRVEMILSDIGFFRMANICLEAQRAADEAKYRDASHDERPCDRCHRPYRGPSLYCSLACALADA